MSVKIRYDEEKNKSDIGVSKIDRKRQGLHKRKKRKEVTGHNHKKFPGQ